MKYCCVNIKTTLHARLRHSCPLAENISDYLQNSTITTLFKKMILIIGKNFNKLDKLLFDKNHIICEIV